MRGWVIFCTLSHQIARTHLTTPNTRPTRSPPCPPRNIHLLLPLLRGPIPVRARDKEAEPHARDRSHSAHRRGYSHGRDLLRREEMREDPRG